MGKELEQTLHQRDYGKYMKFFKSKLAIRQIQINTTMRNHYIFIRPGEVKISDNTKY